MEWVAGSSGISGRPGLECASQAKVQGRTFKDVLDRFQFVTRDLKDGWLLNNRFRQCLFIDPVQDGNYMTTGNWLYARQRVSMSAGIEVLLTDRRGNRANNSMHSCTSRQSLQSLVNTSSLACCQAIQVVANCCVSHLRSHRKTQV